MKTKENKLTTLLITLVVIIFVIQIIEIKIAANTVIKLENKVDKYPCFNEYEHYNCQYVDKGIIIQETDQYGKWFICKNNTESIYRVRAC